MQKNCTVAAKVAAVALVNSVKMKWLSGVLPVGDLELTNVFLVFSFLSLYFEYDFHNK